jgi:primary-amine oxidase
MARYLTPFLLCLTLSDHGVFGAPKSSSSWMRNARQRKATIKGLNTPRDAPYLNDTACIEHDATSVTAPKANIWSGLTDIEASSVTAWLFAQSELNLTITEDAGAWGIDAAK